MLMAITADMLAVRIEKITLVNFVVLSSAMKLPPPWLFFWLNSLNSRTTFNLISRRRGKLKLAYPRISNPDQFTNDSKKGRIVRQRHQNPRENIRKQKRHKFRNPRIIDQRLLCQKTIDRNRCQLRQPKRGDAEQIHELGAFLIASASEQYQRKQIGIVSSRNPSVVDRIGRRRPDQTDAGVEHAHDETGRGHCSVGDALFLGHGR
mmetsp:Transcript_30132/g.62751  ORF Transcript_30132/g.62751 Transcript_30132/m.62751 type:complete len:206 (+) Transcript_30132:122-739(+)